MVIQAKKACLLLLSRSNTPEKDFRIPWLFRQEREPSVVIQKWHYPEVTLLVNVFESCSCSGQESVPSVVIQKWHFWSVFSNPVVVQAKKVCLLFSSRSNPSGKCFRILWLFRPRKCAFCCYPEVTLLVSVFESCGCSGQESVPSVVEFCDFSCQEWMAFLLIQKCRFYKYRRVLWRVRKRKRTFCHGLTNPSWGTVTCDVYWLNLTNISVWTKRTRDGELRFKHDFSLNKLLPARTVNLQSINFVKANFWIVEAKRTIDWYYGTNTLKVTIGEKQKKLGNFLWVSVWITLQT